MQTRNLCRSCFEALDPSVDLASVNDIERDVRGGKCQYCGAEPTTGTVFYGIPDITKEEVRRWCAKCAQDLTEFANQPENKVPQDFDGQEAGMERASQFFSDRKRREEEFMRQRVAERRPKR